MRESWQSFFAKERAIRHLLRGQPDAAGVAFRVNSALARKPRPADSARRLLRVVKVRMAAGELTASPILNAPQLRVSIAAEGGRSTMSQVTAIRALASANASQSLVVNNAAEAARQRIHEIRANAGRRNSQIDQDNLDSAHDALVQAGARHGTNPTAQDAGAAAEHQALLDQAHDALVGAGAACDYADDPITTGTRATGPNAGADNLSTRATPKIVRPRIPTRRPSPPVVRPSPRRAPRSSRGTPRSAPLSRRPSIPTTPPVAVACRPTLTRSRSRCGRR